MPRPWIVRFTWHGRTDGRQIDGTSTFASLEAAERYCDELIAIAADYPKRGHGPRVRIATIEHKGVTA